MPAATIDRAAVTLNDLTGESESPGLTPGRGLDPQRHTMASAWMPSNAKKKGSKSPHTPSTECESQQDDAINIDFVDFSRQVTEMSEKDTTAADTVAEVSETVDISYMVPDAPILCEALQRFHDAQFSDAELMRVHTAHRRFSGREDDLEKDCLDMVASHLGYLLADEDDSKIMANKVSEMSSFDLEELIDFLQDYATHQKDILEHHFSKHVGTDGADTIYVDDLPMVMKDLHIIVLEDNMAELVQRAGLTDKTSLTCMDVARVLAAYRVCEGFTVEKLKEAEEVYEKALEDSRLTITNLPNALLDLFGVHCVTQLRALIDAAGDALSYEGPHTQAVSFHEFLIWARHLQNAELLELMECFELEDDDDDGALSLEELLAVMKQKGFTLFPVEVKEILEAAELSADEGKLFSFDEAQAVLDACRECEGFGNQDKEELTAAFQKFDTDGEGELTTLQVLDLLRYLGYQAGLEDVERYAKKVDFNGNGTMDVDEYMRLMRLHAEDELENVHDVFTKYVGSKTGRLQFKFLHDALKESKCCSSHCDVFDELCGGALNQNVSLLFAEFKVLADKGRKAVKRAQRKKANFSDTEFAALQQAFTQYDIQGDGVLDQIQMLRLLHECGVPVHKSGQRRWGVEMLDQARRAALDAEIAAEDVGEIGSSSVTFWTMVHAWRMIARKNESKKIDRQEEARVASNFSVTEVEEFQAVFSKWAKKDTQDHTEEEAKQVAVTQPRRRSMPDLYSASGKGMQENTREMLSSVRNAGEKPDIVNLQTILGISNVNEQLEFQGLKNLLGSLKVKVSPADLRVLEKEMQTLTGSPDGVLDLANFLCIMRWLLDNNFGHLNDCAAAAAKTAPDRSVEIAAAKSQGVPKDMKVPEAADGARGARLLGRRASF
jgi:calmodulin